MNPITLREWLRGNPYACHQTPMGCHVVYPNGCDTRGLFNLSNYGVGSVSGSALVWLWKKPGPKPLPLP